MFQDSVVLTGLDVDLFNGVERFNIGEELQQIPGEAWRLEESDQAAVQYGREQGRFKSFSLEAPAPGHSEGIGRGYRFDFIVDVVMGMHVGSPKLTAFVIADSYKPVEDKLVEIEGPQAQALYDLVKLRLPVPAVKFQGDLAGAEFGHD